MACQKCKSERVASVSAKCSDLCDVSVNEASHNGYVPDDMNIGGGDYIRFDYCLDCGLIQGRWRVPECKIEEENSLYNLDFIHLGYGSKEWRDAVAETIYEVQSKLNNGRGVHCVMTICHLLEQGNLDSARQVWTTDHDKIRQYTKLEMLIWKHLGCPLHYDEDCSKGCI